MGLKSFSADQSEGREGRVAWRRIGAAMVEVVVGSVEVKCESQEEF